MEEAREIWGNGMYERLAARFAPVQDQLIDGPGSREGRPRARPRDRDRRGGGPRRAQRRVRDGDRHRRADAREARARAKQDRVAITFDLGDVEYLPYDDACFDVIVSNFGVIFAPDHANVAPSSRVCRVPAGCLGFTAWKPNLKLGELYRRFTEEPIEGREVSSGAAMTTSKTCSARTFELESSTDALAEPIRPRRSLGVLLAVGSSCVTLLEQLGDDEGQEFHRASSRYEGERTTAAQSVPRALPARPLEGGK
jgi:hypothetical protein